MYFLLKRLFSLVLNVMDAFFMCRMSLFFLVIICTYNIVIVLFIFHRVLETVCLIFALEVYFTVTLFYLNKDSFGEH